jgi:hypothetical protein
VPSPNCQKYADPDELALTERETLNGNEVRRSKSIDSPVREVPTAMFNVIAFVAGTNRAAHRITYIRMIPVNVLKRFRWSSNQRYMYYDSFNGF